MGEIQKWTDSFVTLLFIWDILVSDTPQWNIYELDPWSNCSQEPPVTPPRPQRPFSLEGASICLLCPGTTVDAPQRAEGQSNADFLAQLHVLVVTHRAW